MAATTGAEATSAMPPTNGEANNKDGAQTKHIAMKHIGLKPIATKPIGLKPIGY